MDYKGASRADTTAYKPIRIRVEYLFDNQLDDPAKNCAKVGDMWADDEDVKTACRDIDVATAEKKTFLKSIVAEAVAYLEKHLKVIPVNGALVGSYGCSYDPPTICDYEPAQYTKDTSAQGFAIPATFLKDGVTGYDYVMFVGMRPTSGSTIAWASPFTQDQYNRPTYGISNFGPNFINPAEHDAQLSTAIHEFLHAFGWLDDGMKKFTKLDGSAHAATLVDTTINGVKVPTLVTPAVKALVADHFGCDIKTANLGAPLEVGGGSGTAGSHFSKTVFGPELMTGTDSKIAVYSKFHLAVLEDSGWYVVDYGASIPPLTGMTWGYKQGCNFIFKTCADYPASAKTAGFTCTTGDKGCGEEGFTSIAECGELDSLMSFGGVCSQMVPTQDGSCIKQLGAAGACFIQGGAPTCIERKCVKDAAGAVTQSIKIDGKWIDCPNNGGSPVGQTDVTCLPSSLACQRDLLLSAPDAPTDGPTEEVKTTSKVPAADSDNTGIKSAAGTVRLDWVAAFVFVSLVIHALVL